MMNAPGIHFSAVLCCIVAGGLGAAVPAEPEPKADQQSPLRATARRADSRVRFVDQGDRIVCDVSSSLGIDRAVIERCGEQWPAPIVVRLRLRGLESFKVTSGNVTVEWSASTAAAADARVTLWKDSEERTLDSHSPYYSAVRFYWADVSRPSSLPGGYFQVTLPAKLFEQNPQQIVLQWIDFYRG